VSGKTFIYGELCPREKEPDGNYAIALEILREFSGVELVGRPYEKRNGEWQPCAEIWWERRKSAYYHQLLIGGKFWDIKSAHNESNNAGPYLAFWVKQQ